MSSVLDGEALIVAAVYSLIRSGGSAGVRLAGAAGRGHRHSGCLFLAPLRRPARAIGLPLTAAKRTCAAPVQAAGHIARVRVSERRLLSGDRGIGGVRSLRALQRAAPEHTVAVAPSRLVGEVQGSVTMAAALSATSGPF